MNEFKHLFLIVFNIYFEDYGIYNNKKWFEERFRIFKNLTLKSILGQTDKNFTCLVFFCEKWCGKENIKIINSTEDIVPVFLPEEIYNSDLHLLPILNKYRENNKYLIITKFDSDDLINKDYVKSINNLKLEDYTNKILCSQYGYIYRKFDDFFIKFFWESPSIFTIIEKSNNINIGDKVFEKHGKVFSMFNEKYGKESIIPIEDLKWFKCEHENSGVLSSTNFPASIKTFNDKKMFNYLKRKPKIINRKKFLSEKIPNENRKEICDLFCIDLDDLNIL